MTSVRRPSFEWSTMCCSVVWDSSPCCGASSFIITESAPLVSSFNSCVASSRTMTDMRRRDDENSSTSSIT
jgi:hypothetical protein